MLPERSQLLSGVARTFLKKRRPLRGGHDKQKSSVTVSLTKGPDQGGHDKFNDRLVFCEIDSLTADCSAFP